MEIIVVDDLSSALKLYDFNKNRMVLLNLKHIISKRKRESERERKPWLRLLLQRKQNL